MPYDALCIAALPLCCCSSPPPPPLPAASCRRNWIPPHHARCIRAACLPLSPILQALIDGPVTLTGVPRQTIPFRNLSLTSIKLEIPRAIRSGTLAKAFTKADVLGQWQKTTWARKLARHATRSALGDFDRFKLMLLRKKKSMLINKEFGKLRRAANPQAKKAAAGAKKPAAAKKA